MSRRPKVSAKRRELAAFNIDDWSGTKAPAALALILLTTLLVYMPAMNGRPLLDDDLYFTKPALQTWGGLCRIWFDPAATAEGQYYPLVHTAFWCEYRLWGDAYAGYHLVNVLWHLLAVVLVYAILSKLRIPGALLTAAIFALHPVMAESVAWMCEQKNTLSTVLYLSAMLVYLKFDESRRHGQYLGALGLFALALLAKTITVTLPVALLVIFWWQRGTLSWRRDVLPLIPFFAIGLASGLMTIRVENSYFHPELSDVALSASQRFLLSGRAVWFYVGKLVWPAVAFIYPRWTLDPAQWWQWVFPITALVTTYALWTIRKRSRAPLAGWLFFCATLFPVLGLLNVHYFIYSFVADHFQYLASLGMIVPAAAGIALLLKRMSPNVRRLGDALCLLLIATLAALTFRQSSLYADSVTLYRATIDRNPDCWMAHNNLGLALSAQGNSEAAIDHFYNAVRLRPNFFGAHHNLGNALVHAGRVPEGIEELQAALMLKPDDLASLNTLGAALIQAGQYVVAAQQFERALHLRPDDALAHYNLGVLLSYTDKTVEAIGHYKQAIRLSPNYAHAHNALGAALQHLGETQGAIEHYQTALRLEPNFVPAYANLVQVLAIADQSQEAVAAAEKGIAVARATGREAAAQQLEEWLKHYRSELRRRENGATEAPAQPTEQ